MITFANPFYFIGLIFILALFLYHRFFGKKLEGTFSISSESLISNKMKRRGKVRYLSLRFLNYTTLFFILIGLTRPQLIDSIKETNVDVVDIVLVMDISSSMLATDFPPNRLEAVKNTAKNFIKARTGDRLGVLVFAGESFIQCPLTIDQDVLISLMDEIKIAEQSYDGTAIGMAIANATNRLRHSESKSKVMILLSDGSGRGYIRNEIDEETLKSISKRTNGQYFRATNLSGLEQVYDTIDALERTEIEIKEFTQYKELFGWFLIPALILGLSGQVLDRNIFRKRL